MYQSAADLLEARTKEYWRISNSVLGRSKERLTAAAAIDATNKLAWNLGPQRSLLRKVQALSNVVIEGKRTKKQQPATISIPNWKA